MFLPVLIAVAAVTAPAVANGTADPPAAGYPRVRGTTVTVKNDLFFLIRHGGAVTAARLTADPRRGRGEELDRRGQAILYRWFRRPASTFGFHDAGPAVTTGTGHTAEGRRDATGDFEFGPLRLVWSGAGDSPQTYLYFTQLEGPAEIYPEQFRSLRDADRLDPDRFVSVLRPTPPADAPPADDPTPPAAGEPEDDAPADGGPSGEPRNSKPDDPRPTDAVTDADAAGETGPADDLAPEFKGLTVGVRHDAFLLIRRAGAVTAVRLSADPARANLLMGHRGVDYRWYRRPVGTPFFLPIGALPPGAAGNAAVTGGAGRATDGTGAAVRTDDLRVPWSMGGAKTSWLYFDEVEGPVEVYREQFRHLVDADDLTPDRWVTLRREPARPAAQRFGFGFGFGPAADDRLGEGGF